MEDPPSPVKSIWELADRERAKSNGSLLPRREPPIGFRTFYKPSAMEDLQQKQYGGRYNAKGAARVSLQGHSKQQQEAIPSHLPDYLTTAASADLASLETATLSKLRLARHHVRKAWICWASKPSAHPAPLVPTLWGSPIILALDRTLSRLLAAIGEPISATRRASTQHPTSWQRIWNSPDHYICAKFALLFAA
ncbi:hypothetical protein CSAL01_08251 [Colletotrichum salicis]|uniref:Uncharacterized protein n=1 Tax=Colletotrichum salicis TaxID=1209931 RepID=A0A135UZV8_9PEZI|nr:hypothetical protein CSAL01_08251 [Colletotrichum salicis]